MTTTDFFIRNNWNQNTWDIFWVKTRTNLQHWSWEVEDWWKNSASPYLRDVRNDLTEWSIKNVDQIQLWSCMIIVVILAFMWARFLRIMLKSYRDMLNKVNESEYRLNTIVGRLQEKMEKYESDESVDEWRETAHFWRKKCREITLSQKKDETVLKNVRDVMDGPDFRNWRAVKCDNLSALKREGKKLGLPYTRTYCWDNRKALAISIRAAKQLAAVKELVVVNNEEEQWVHSEIEEDVHEIDESSEEEWMSSGDEEEDDVAKDPDYVPNFKLDPTSSSKRVLRKRVSPAFQTRLKKRTRMQ